MSQYDNKALYIFVLQIKKEQKQREKNEYFNEIKKDMTINSIKQGNKNRKK